jgi:hypothetical protein
MTEPAVSLERMAHLTLLLCEAGLGALADGNGGAAPTAELRYVLGRLSTAAPGTALRCPRVRASLPPEALAAAIAQVSAAPATPPAAPPPQAADSLLGSTAAARALGISGAAVRAAAARGSLRGQRDRITGAWVFTASAVKEYRRDHAERRR